MDEYQFDILHKFIGHVFSANIPANIEIFCPTLRGLHQRAGIAEFAGPALDYR